MKIVQLSTFDVKGGAARAAYRLHQGLLGLGHESSMVVRAKSSSDPNVYQSADCPDWSEWELVQKKCIDENRTAISNTYFSLSAPGCDVSAHPAVQAADIIQLHWVTWFQSPMSILRVSILGKPIVWTLHDQRAFTGGCHFSAGCKRYEESCGSCPQLRKDWFDLTRATVCDQHDTFPKSISAVVSPSEWLAECARRSAVFRDIPVSVIANGIETDMFAARPKDAARVALSLEPDAFWFLFGSDNISIKRRGLHFLVEALKRALRDKNFSRAVQDRHVRFATFGGGIETELPVPVKNFGRIKSDEQLAQIYAAADVLLLPSLEDNLPNVMIEALCCGTPVLAMRVGGIPDAIEDGVNGRLVSAGDVRGFAEAMCGCVQDRQLTQAMSANCGREMPGRYSLQRQALGYVALYEQLLERSRKVTESMEVERRIREIFPALLDIAQNTKPRGWWPFQRRR